MAGRRFIFESAEYETLGDKTAQLVRITGKLDRFMVPSVAISQQGKRYKIIKILNESDLSEEEEKRMKSETVKEISFKKTSKIEHVPFSLFYCCESDIFLPNSLKRIDCDVFNDKKLPNIHIPRGNKFVSISHNKSIMNHFPLELINQFHCWPHLIIRETVQSVGPYAFYRNLRLTTVVFPSSIKVICRSSFFGCSNLRNVVFKANSRLMKIDQEAFEYDAIAKIIFPSSLEEICEFAFNDAGVASIEFPIDSRLRVIERWTFFNSTVESIKFPSSLEEIGEYAFNESGLKSIEFPIDSRLRVIGRNAFSSTCIESIEFPSSLEEIGEFAFYECQKLISIIFPADSRLKKIEYNTFDEVIMELFEFPPELIDFE